MKNNENDSQSNFTDAEIVEIGGYNSFAVEGDANLSALDDDFFNADDDDFENAGGRRKGCKELKLKGKKLRQCAKDLKKSGYTKGGEIPESVMRKYAPQLIQKAASEMSESVPKTRGAVNNGLIGGIKKAGASPSAVSDTSGSEETAKMSAPKKAAIGIGVVVAILVVGLIIRKVTAAKA